MKCPQQRARELTEEGLEVRRSVGEQQHKT